VHLQYIPDSNFVIHAATHCEAIQLWEASAVEDAIFTVSQWLSDREPSLHLDEDGVAGLQRDSQTLLILEVPRDSQVCHLYAPVSTLPEENPELALLAALELNRFGRPLGGCWLAWDPDVAMLTLCHNLYVPAYDSVSFNKTIDNFMISLDQARKECSDEKWAYDQPYRQSTQESTLTEIQKDAYEQSNRENRLMPNT
jgi:hypothetical protein